MLVSGLIYLLLLDPLRPCNAVDGGWCFISHLVAHHTYIFWHALVVSERIIGEMNTGGTS